MLNKTIVRAMAKSEAEKAYELNNHSDQLTTTDATPEIIASIEIPEYSTGILEIELAAMVDDGSAKFTAKWLIGFHKDTTLTLDTETALHSQNFIAGASFDVVNDSENPAVEVTGVAATGIVWQARINQFVLTITPVAP